MGCSRFADSVFEYVTTKPFQSAVMCDEQIFGQNTMVASMLKSLDACDRPPPLEKLNQFREDGKDGSTFYSDPNYFFEFWRQEMLQVPDKNLEKVSTHLI